MDFEALQKLEERVGELTDTYLGLKKNHEEVLAELASKDMRIEELNEKLGEFQQTKLQIHSRIENILKRLEFLKTQSDG